jgi:hypothetical protein
MAIRDDQNAIEIYNYETFSRSESAGKSTEFKNSLRAGDEAPDFELPTCKETVCGYPDSRQKALAPRVWQYYLTAVCGRGLAPK